MPLGSHSLIKWCPWGLDSSTNSTVLLPNVYNDYATVVMEEQLHDHLAQGLLVKISKGKPPWSGVGKPQAAALRDCQGLSIIDPNRGILNRKESSITDPNREECTLHLLQEMDHPCSSASGKPHQPELSTPFSKTRFIQSNPFQLTFLLHKITLLSCLLDLP